MKGNVIDRWREENFPRSYLQFHTANTFMLVRDRIVNQNPNQQQKKFDSNLSTRDQTIKPPAERCDMGSLQQKYNFSFRKSIQLIDAKNKVR